MRAFNGGALKRRPKPQKRTEAFRPNFSTTLPYCICRSRSMYLQKGLAMKHEYTIDACSGKCIPVAAGQKITVIDVDGAQVADFFAERLKDPREFLSTAVTIDCNASIRLNPGDFIYSNLYRPMFQIIADDVGAHDLLFPCCRPEMYDFFYHNGKGHPNCFDAINRSLDENRPIIQPINLFMHTKLHENGKVTVEPPLSKAGSKILLSAKMDMRLGIAACSVSESNCNNGKCSAIKVIVEDGVF